MKLSDQLLEKLVQSRQISDLPAAERARRERALESAGGIVGYAVDRAGRRACFVLAGALFVVELDSGAVTPLPVSGSVFDPRLDPDGTRIRTTPRITPPSRPSSRSHVKTRASNTGNTRDSCRARRMDPCQGRNRRRRATPSIRSAFQASARSGHPTHHVAQTRPRAKSSLRHLQVICSESHLHFFSESF